MAAPTRAADKTIIFLHIPKTAGTTLHRIAERQYPSKHIFTIGRLSHESVQQFKNLSEAQRAEFRLVKGHLPFGFHALVPGPSTYFTVLRDPVERVISFYNWVHRTPHHYLYDFMTSNKVGLKEYIEAGSNIMLDNAQTRMLSGVWYDAPFGDCTEEILGIAKRNLRERFAVVGLTKEFDKTLLLLKKAFGWGKLFYVRQNVSDKGTDWDKLPRATLDAIMKTNLLDLELYQYATMLFERQVAQQGHAFIRAVERFQATNRLLYPYTNLLWKARQVSLKAFSSRWIKRLTERSNRTNA